MTQRPAVTRRARAAGPAVVVGVLCAALLGACTGTSDDPDDPAPSATTTTAPTTEPADPDAPLSAQQACAAMYVDGDEPLERRVVAALVDVSEGADTESVQAMTAVGIELGSLSVRVPEEFTDAVDQVRVPFLQLQENLDTATEESVDLDVASAHAGLTAYRELCGTTDGTGTGEPSDA
ncbi:hypothetical protein [Cellulosimicrobium marinum]|uniref:hypothetical protein n=1 Tax=Cellulosimicrobium marinum TaxID=1638992 RepID=UPI001E570850|nr:hypothetical protein [Cellulosimicrobium marinum]MCB7135208.1 hypothetical protein [Cellulosimicrobium marinum]